MRRTSALLVLGFVALVPLAAAAIREYVAVDRCLDAGGSYDYTAARCDHQRTHTVRPFAERQRALLLGTGVAALALSVGAAIARGRNGRRRASAPAGA
jgi:hypothetical protein